MTFSANFMYFLASCKNGQEREQTMNLMARSSRLVNKHKILFLFTQDNDTGRRGINLICINTFLFFFADLNKSDLYSFSMFAEQLSHSLRHPSFLSKKIESFFAKWILITKKGLWYKVDRSNSANNLLLLW